ncbi:MAG: flagellar motor protein [Actinobacteria bacterium]|nr:flagellar motor protein [Actinomycetota bacterium]
MDIATLIGLVISIASILVGMVLGGGSIRMYWQLAAAIIVVGGTFGASFMCFSLRDNVKILTKAGMKALFVVKHDFRKQIDQIVTLAKVARKEGLLSLEKEMDKIKDPFLRKGIQLTIDGLDSSKIIEILETEIAELEQRHKKGISWFRAAGGFAPTMGLLGTVMGLIVILGNLEDPDSISKGIGAAFLTTLYGVILANLFFLPVANKLNINSAEEVKMKQLMLKGVLGIQSGSNPRIIEEELVAFVPRELLLNGNKGKQKTGQKVNKKSEPETGKKTG